MTSLLRSVDGQKKTTTETIEVKRLDQLSSDVVEGISQPRVFMKIDTQGYDLEVFAGSTECLRHIHGIQSELSVQPIYIEMPNYQQSLAVYEDSGFEIFNLSAVNRVPTGGLLELNAFMKRRSEKGTQ